MTIQNTYKKYSAKDIYTIFKSAGYNGDLELIKYFLDKPLVRKNVNISHNIIYDCYLNACRNGRVNIIDFFLNHENENIKVSSKRNDVDDTGLYSACFKDKVETVEYLLLSNKEFEKINISDYRVKDAFIMACETSAYKIIQFFLYDLQYPITKNILSYLNGENMYNKSYTDALKMIEKRDLFFKINDDISNQEPLRNKNIEKSSYKI